MYQDLYYLLKIQVLNVTKKFIISAIYHFTQSYFNDEIITSNWNFERKCFKKLLTNYWLLYK